MQGLYFSTNVNKEGMKSMSDPHIQQKYSSLVLEEVRPKLKKPPLYKVLLLNDDFTPMDFVVDVLAKYFAMQFEKAVQIMLEVHTQGKGVCGVFTRDIAETKVEQVSNYAKTHEHPLLCIMEIA